MKVACQIVALVFILSIAGQAKGYIRGEDLDRKVTVTERQQLLSQVDTVSLYLSSDRVGYAPELTYDNKIQVEATVLDEALLADHEAMKDFVSRQISVFKREVARRLMWAAPSIAAHFDPDTDMVFIIKEGNRRQTVAQVGSGGWRWSGKTASAYSSKSSRRTASRSDTSLSQARSEGRRSCNCPALVGKK